MTSCYRPACVFTTLMILVTSADAQAPTPELRRGQVLLLDNDRILEGDIERIDGQYRIRRSIGELWIPAGRSKRLCKDLDDAYSVMSSQSNLRDPDERIRLARWCHMNGLKDRALQEAKIALDMRPDHVESLQLLQMLQRFAISSSPALATQPPAPTPVVKMRMASSASPDVSAESFAVFATRVQPIFMNTCLTCHSNGKGGGFQLVRATEGGARAAAQTNLTMALEYLDLERPVLSPLLIKAVVAHGSATTAPLKGRQSIPYQTLQKWVDHLIASNPHLKEIRQAESTPAASSISAKKDYFNEVFASVPVPAMPAAPPASADPVVPIAPVVGPKRTNDVAGRPTPRMTGGTPPVVAPPASSLPSIPSTPTIAPTPVAPRDPFDPAEFNARPK